MREKFWDENIQEPLIYVAVDVLEKKRVGSLNTGNRYVVSDDVQHTVDTRNVIATTKPDLFS